MARKPNPVYLRGLEEGEMRGIAKSTKKIKISIESFEKMEGVGKKTMDKLYEAFGLDKELSKEEAERLDRKWGRYNATQD